MNACRWLPLCLILGVLALPMDSAAGTAPETGIWENFIPPAAIPFPDYNRRSDAKVELGRTLFFDPRLSGANDLACASCHQPEKGWEDGEPKAQGADGHQGTRHTPTLINRAWGRSFAWDGRLPTLEAFVLGPIANKNEMNQPPDSLMGELKAIAGYRQLFSNAFPGKPMSIDQVSLSIATFMRTITVRSTPFDRWIKGDTKAMPLAAIKGFRLFTGKAGCSQCHSGWNFTDENFHDTGLKSADRGRGGLPNADPSDAHHFKTPTLRNISMREPYMHDGSLATLSDVIDHYRGGFERRYTLSPLITARSLSDEDKLNLEAFLHMLSEDNKSIIQPEIPE